MSEKNTIWTVQIIPPYDDNCKQEFVFNSQSQRSTKSN